VEVPPREEEEIAEQTIIVEPEQRTSLGNGDEFLFFVLEFFA
jgi:hypothetical protein